MSDDITEVPAARTGSGLYDAAYYRSYEGGTYDRGGHWTRFFGYISDEVVARFAPRSTLDAGCALGVFVEELRARGVDAWGVDVSEFAIASAPEALRPYCHVASLAEPLPDVLPRRFDLVTCIEVLEHMERDEGDRAIAHLTAITDTIVFSSTPDGFAEATHIACRRPEEWSAVFARHGFFRDFDADASFLAPWAVVYRRTSLTTLAAVLRYDREVSRLVDENRQLRARVIELDHEVTAGAGSSETVEALRLQVLTARDEALAAQAQVAAVRAMDLDDRRQLRERVHAQTVAQTRSALEARGVELARLTADYRLGRLVLTPARWARRVLRERR